MRNPEPETDLLEVEAVARYLGVQRSTIYAWCRGGRLPCLKVGKTWRIRRSALDEFLLQSERRPALTAQLSAFLVVPDFVLAVAASNDLLNRLDSTFFQVGDVRGALLVKFYGGELDATPGRVRRNLSRYGLDVDRLDAEGRLLLRSEARPLESRSATLQRFLAERAGEGQTIWASFDWNQTLSFEMALRQQSELAMVVGAERLVVKTVVLEEIADAWTPAWRRRFQQLHGGLIELTGNDVLLSRRVALAEG